VKHTYEVVERARTGANEAKIGCFGAWVSCAILLALSEQGVVLQEDAEATQSAGGQTLGELPGLVAPNTVQYGLNADKDLSVAATAVVGRLDEVDPTYFELNMPPPALRFKRFPK
jgi:hypothetical protein